MNCLIVTHNFPRFESDLPGNFILRLLRNFRECRPFVVAPWSRGVAVRERYGQIEVRRFRYAVPPLPEIAYRGEMQKLAFKSPMHFTSLALLSLSMMNSAFSMAGNVEVVNAHWLVPAGLLSAPVSLLKNRPLVITMHGTDSVLFSKFHRFLNLKSRIFMNLKAITVVSSFIAESIKPFVPENVEVKVVPMPVEDEIFDPSLRAKVNPEYDVVYVGRITRQKNVDGLIKAVDLLRKDYGYPARLLIVGDGPHRPRLMELVDQLGLRSLVDFRGRVRPSDVPFEMARGRVIALLSYREGFGLSVLEGMKMGLPQVGSDDGGIRDIVLDGVTGFLVPPDDPRAAAEALFRLLSDDSLYSAMSERSIERGKTVFSARSLSKKFEDILLKAASTSK